MISSKDLAAVNDAVMLDHSQESGGAVAFQYGATGAGTVVLEVSLDTVEWVVVQATNQNTGTAAATATVPGIYTAIIHALTQVRVRKTVGTASCPITLSVKRA